MNCPKCQAEAPASAVECPSCGVVMAKVAEAMDRALLRRHTASKVEAPPPPKSSATTWITIIAIVACIFGAWSWYTDDTESDLDRLATEIRNTPAAEAELTSGSTIFMWRNLTRFGIAIVVFVAGYMHLKNSLSP